jgi:putative phosphoesterase
MAVTAMLNSVKDRLFCVRGNCDADVDQLVLEFPVLADHALMSVDGVELFVTHGHLHDDSNPPPLKQGSYLLCGHIHLPVCRSKGHFTYLNPGSLALPKEGTPRSYLTLDNGVFTWHELETGAEFQPLP